MDQFSEGLIKPDLILLLRNILDSYPDNGQILKELIQNAEDAGATQIKLLLDEGSYPSQNLYRPELDRFQGPALYAFNDSEFSERDWRGICLLHDSIKKENSNTIGRFGVGFKSVFHMTDFPGILSGYGIGFIDPYERYFSNPRTGDRSSCKLWNFKNPEVANEMLAIWDQFQPFCQGLFYSTSLRHHLQNGYKNKTLFRFPLRRPHNDGTSRLSDKAYTTDAIKTLFQSLEAEAKEILLFLSKLQKVEAYVKSADGSVSLFFSVCKTLENIPVDRGLAGMENISILFNLVNIKIEHSNNSTMEAKFLILLCDSPISDLQDIALISTKLGVARRVGLAINLADVQNVNRKVAAATWSKGGQLFCFLPLPKGAESATGFAFHIHACFIVDQNRSKIKMPPNIKQGNTGEDLKWNWYLIHNAIPNAMVVLSKVISSSALGIMYPSLNDKLNLIFTIMPHPECARKDWESTMRAFYSIIFSNAYNMWFVSPRYNQFTGINADTYFALWLEENNTELPIHEVLRKMGKKVIYVSENVLLALRNQSKALRFREVTPDSLSLALKRYNKLTELESTTKSSILSYLLSDIQTSSNILNRLEGLELIPLEDGIWTILQPSLANAPCIYISSREHSIQLLPGLEHSFLKEDIALDLKKAIELIANTGRTQLTYISQNIFLDLLQYVRGLQPSYDIIIPNNHASFDDEYLSNLWNYIRRNNIDLKVIEARCFHIIPKNLDMTEMVLLSSRLPLLIGDESVDQRVIQCCQEMGIVVLEYLPGYIRDCPGIFGKYAFPFNTPGITECIRRVGVQQAASKLYTISSELRIAFRKFVESHLINFLLPRLPPPEQEVLQYLPLFETVDGSGFLPTHIVSAADVNLLATENFQSRITLSVKFIQIIDKETSKLATVIGVSIYSKFDILKQFILPGIREHTYNQKDIEQFMIIVFQDFKSILDDADFLRENICDLSFIPTKSGRLMRACDLFDSNDEVLSTIFVGGDKFPSGELASDEFKPVLIRLGLKSLSDITIVDVISAAELVSNNPNDEKCATMMKFVENNIENILRSGPHVNQTKNLQKYAWVDTNKVVPERYPVGLEFRTGYSAPSQVRSSEYCQLIGSIHPTVDTKKWPVLSKLFGWCEQPTNEDIISHLYKIVEFYNRDSNSSDERNNLIPSIQDITESIYRELNLRAQQQRLSPNCRKKFLDGQFHSLFIEGKFMSPNMCAKDYDRGSQCMPWICGLSPHMNEKFKFFIEFIGIKNKFDTGDFLKVLRDIKSKKSEGALEDHELKVVITVIKDLASSIRVNERRQFSGINVYLPDVNGILREANNLWLQTTTTSLSEDEVEGKHECHKDVSHEDGKLLGVAMKDKIVLSQYTKSFGQSEKLTKRIRRLLLTTPFGLETFKELIQNADDAGATEVQIILDARNLSSDKVFNEGWKKLQGPALSIYNNKPFTSEDLKGIQSLGEGSKEHELTKTGQYGVGFNAVYHLTDVPSILTTVTIDIERVLCVFDPTHKFVCESKETGIKFYNIEHLKSKFPDSFIGYLEEEFRETGGSFLRLPLRTCASDLSDFIPGIESIEDNLLSWRNEFSLQLLFVNNITKISVRRINDSNNELESLYCLQSEKLNISSSLPFTEFGMYLAFYKKFATSIANGSNILKNTFTREVSYKLRLKKTITDELIKDKVESVTDYLVIQTFGFKNGNSIPLSIVGLHQADKLTVLPRGGVAFQLPSKDSQSIDVTNKMKLFCSLPIAGELHLPVHVNGCFYLDHDSRRSLLNEETAGQRAGWNTYLIENVISEAYLKLLSVTKGLVESEVISMDIYMKLFPDVPENDSYPESVIAKALYRAIASLPLMPVQKISNSDPVLWLSPASGYFETINDLKTNSKQLSGIPGDSNILRIILHKCGLYLFEKKTNLFQNFCRSSVAVKEASPENILLFYKGKEENIFQGCVSSDQKIFSELVAVLNILNYCKDCSNFKSLLCNTPLLVTEDGTVTHYAEDNKKYVSEFLSIVPHAQYQFVHKDIVRDLSLNPAKEGDKIFCKHLTIKCFESFLQTLIGGEQFENNQSNKFISMSLLVNKLQPYKNKLTENDWNYTWLKRVWKFLEKEIDRLMITEGIPKNNKEKYARDCVKYLGNWHLFPVCRQEADGIFREYLTPVSNCHRIMSQDYMKRHLLTLRPILLQMKVPFILSKSESPKGYDIKLISLLTGMETYLASVLLIGMLASLDLENLILPREDQKTILNYLEAHLDEYKDLGLSKATIRRLPFYQTIDGHLTALTSEHTVSMLPRDSKIPNIDLKNCIEESGYSRMIVLRNEGSIEKLLRFLDCNILTESDLYLNFILKTLSSMQYEDCLKHLEYIRDELFGYRGVNNEANFKSILSQLRFISDPRYSLLKKAADYYDPRVALFQSMKEICTFPPKPFYDATNVNNTRWLDFLIVCGLVNNVEDSHITKFATHIRNKFENGKETERTTATNLSNILLQHISKNVQSISEHCFKELKEIKFITAYTLNSSYNPETIICLMDSYLYKDRDIIFTVGNILPQSLSVYCNEAQLQMLCRKAGIKKDPSEDDVVQNLVNVSRKNTNIKQIYESAERLRHICMESFKFLNDSLAVFSKSLAEMNRKKLLETPCIGMGTADDFRFVLPNRFVFKAYRQFPPHLYILPDEYRAYTTIMLNLEVKEVATADRYIYVLAKIKSGNSNELPESDLKMALDAMKGLLLTLTPDITADTFTRNTLFLPGYFIASTSSAGQHLPKISLHEANEVIIDDRKIKVKRLRNDERFRDNRPMLYWKFEKYDDLNQENAEKRMELIPLEYRPKFLSHVIQERLITNKQGHSSDGELEEKFRSKRFYQAIVRLAIHSGEVTKSDTELELLKKELTGLRDFKVLKCASVQTKYYDTFDQQQPFKIQHSEADVQFFIKGATVYLNRNISDSFSKDVLNSKLAEVLNDLTKNRLSNVMHKVPPILNCELEKMENILKEMGVPEVYFDDDDDVFYEAQDNIGNEASGYSGENYYHDISVSSLPNRSNLINSNHDDGDSDDDDDDDDDDDIADDNDNVAEEVIYHPNLPAAGVWLKQAEHDLKSAENDLNADKKYYEWSCYKCHQAAEKAIKAILLASKGTKYDGHGLENLILEIPNSGGENREIINKLTQSATRLNSITGGYSAMRYPSSNSPQVPHDKLGSNDAAMAKQLSESIVKVSREFIRQL